MNPKLCGTQRECIIYFLAFFGNENFFSLFSEKKKTSPLFFSMKLKTSIGTRKKERI